MLEKILFIINPNAGMDRVKALQKQIDLYLDKNIFQPEIVYTQYPQHGTEIAHNAAINNIRYIVAVGGDGSVNDVAKGIYGTDAVMGILPQGSGNGLARSLQIPLDVREAITSLNKKHIEKIDVGNAGGHLFLSNAGVGFDVLVAKKFRTSKRRGLLVYSWIVLKHFWKYKEWEWEIEVDGKLLKEKAFIVTVANGKQFGYNFKIAPLAELQDGLLDIVIIKKFPKVLGGLITMRAFRSSIHKSKYVEYLKGKQVIIRNAQLKYLQTDGDVYMFDNEEVCIKLSSWQLHILL